MLFTVSIQLCKTVAASLRHNFAKQLQHRFDKTLQNSCNLVSIQLAKQLQHLAFMIKFFTRKIICERFHNCFVREMIERATIYDP